MSNLVDGAKLMKLRTALSRRAERSPNLTEKTIRIFQQRKMRFNSRTTRYYLDNKAPGYGWLLPGWIVEERRMEHGRVYRVPKNHHFLISFPSNPYWFFDLTICLVYDLGSICALYINFLVLI
ncbi:hypothetical protein L6164_037692 [Bauhinia variegata]|uniref:Uncharacterized protein n=1 Tax=Bauhinia variegata TaxID=167791 RepID=A0ACB9KL11_BAUVA|nr:hypothetical protein L6164_037692 [Bauhinia variegata]